jgi:hypothetical protein
VTTAPLEPEPVVDPSDLPPDTPDADPDDDTVEAPLDG